MSCMTKKVTVLESYNYVVCELDIDRSNLELGIRFSKIEIR